MTHLPTDILDTWEQSLEDATTISLGVDPYGVMDLARSARAEQTLYVHIPVSVASLSRIHMRAEEQNKTTTSYLRELVEYA